MALLQPPQTTAFAEEEHLSSDVAELSAPASSEVMEIDASVGGQCNKYLVGQASHAGYSCFVIEGEAYTGSEELVLALRSTNKLVVVGVELSETCHG